MQAVVQILYDLYALILELSVMLETGMLHVHTKFMQKQPTFIDVCLLL